MCIKPLEEGHVLYKHSVNVNYNFILLKRIEYRFSTAYIHYNEITF